MWPQKKKENHFEINAYQVACPLHVQHVKLANNIKIHVTLWHIVYVYTTALSLNLI